MLRAIAILSALLTAASCAVATSGTGPNADEGAAGDSSDPVIPGGVHSIPMTGGMAGSANRGGTAGGPAESMGGAVVGGTTNAAGSSGVDSVCGNGEVEPSEDCDDGNTNEVDGCAYCDVVCPNGYTEWEAGNHHCYRWGASSDTWSNARDDCARDGGYLVSISSSDENDYIESLIDRDAWIGANEPLGDWEDASVDDGDPTGYCWDSGEEFGEYENFAAGEPNRTWKCELLSCAHEHCAQIFDGSGEWNDRRCDREHGYVCEWVSAGL